MVTNSNIFVSRAISEETVQYERPFAFVRIFEGIVLGSQSMNIFL